MIYWRASLILLLSACAVLMDRKTEAFSLGGIRLHSTRSRDHHHPHGRADAPRRPTQNPSHVMMNSQRRRQRIKLWNAAKVESIQASNVSSSPDPTVAKPLSTTSPRRSTPKYDMAWSENQVWGLKDHLAKYTIQVHMEQDGRDTLQVYTLWRNLANDVPALSGYPLTFLVDRYREMRNETNNIQTSTEILPFLDGYTFEPDGGVSGRVYGIAGVAEGTRIQTTPVAGVESTLQKGYILTQEGILYELGLPASQTAALDGKPSRMAQRAASSLTSAANDVPLSEVVENDELVKLAGLTAVVISGAWAMETLSHHLTVNVFWV